MRLGRETAGQLGQLVRGEITSRKVVERQTVVELHEPAGLARGYDG
jgi:hypothetical protein